MSDIFRYSSMEDHLEILEWTLRVRHISPTAPDTLGNVGLSHGGRDQRPGRTQGLLRAGGLGASSGAWCLLGGLPGTGPVGAQQAAPALSRSPSSPGCYPFYKTDPFILLECPHVYFCGNTPRFGSKIIRGEFHLLGAPGWAVARDFRDQAHREENQHCSPRPRGVDGPCPRVPSRA